MTSSDIPLPVRRRRFGPWPAAAAVAAAGIAAAMVLDAAADGLPSLVPAYPDWANAFPSPRWFLWWVLGDTTEATLYKSALAGLLMICGAAFAHLGPRRLRGFPLACGTDRWPWVMASSGMALLASNLVWGWTLTTWDAWQPTFAPFVSVPPAMVVMYGGGWAVATTGAVLGVVLVTPISLVAVHEACLPLELSPVVGSVAGMCLGGAAAFALARQLPWLPKPPTRPVEPPDGNGQAATTARGAGWVVRRVLADFTEAPFIGNEWAGAALLVGAVATFVLNPDAIAYASGLFPHILAAQVLASVCGVMLWRRCWARHGWYPTFVPIVSVAPATVLTYGGTAAAVLAGAVLGAVAAPPLAAAAARRLPAYIAPMVAYTGAMAVCTAAIVPALDLFPGFTAG